MADVVVVGAGLVGLACARRLAALGHGVEVLERARAPGGRLRTRRGDGFILEPAGAGVCRADRHLLALLRDAGLADTVVEGDPRRGVWQRGRVTCCDVSTLRGLLRTAPLRASARARLPWLLFALYRARRALDPERPEAALAHDDESLASHLRGLGEDVAAGVLTPALAALRDEAPEEVSAGLGLLALRRLQEAGGTPLLVPGGPGRLLRALADRVPVRVGWEVTAVEPDPRGVQLRFVAPSGERVRRAEGAVLAVPAAEVARICPARSAAEETLLARHREAPPRMAVHLLFEKAPPPLPAAVIDVSAAEPGLLRQVAAMHGAAGLAPEGAGCLRVELRPEAAAACARDEDAEVAERVHGALEEIAGRPLAPGAVRVDRDAAPPRCHGPGALAAWAALRRETPEMPRVLACGYRTAASPEGAAAAGWRAADALHAALGGDPDAQPSQSRSARETRSLQT